MSRTRPLLLETHEESTSISEGIWSPRHRRLTLGLVLLISGPAFEGLAVATILPRIVANLGGLSLYGWSFSAYMLATILGLILAGDEADRKGPALPFIFGVSLFVLGLILAGTAPRGGRLVADAVSPNSFLYLPINQVYDQQGGTCMANTSPFACEISVNGPFDGILPRNAFRVPGTYYQDTAVMKNFFLPKEGMKLQFRAELYNLFNHPNLYVNGGTNDVNAQTFTQVNGHTAPGVTASFRDSRQIVLALKLMF